MPKTEQELIRYALMADYDELPYLKFTDYTLKLELEEPNLEVLEIAQRELRENPDRTKEAVQQLIDLLKEETDLKVPIHKEAWLIRFLRPCKFYPESALQLIKNYYQFKVKHANIYDGLSPVKEKNIFQSNVITVMPNRDQYGRRNLILALGKNWNHKKVTLDEVFKGVVLFMEIAMLEPETQIAGANVIFDMDGLSLQQTWQFTPPFAKRIVDWIQDAIPLRIKSLHVVNQPYIFNMVFALFKPFLREKLKSRIHFHGTDRKSLHEHMSPKFLPESYGGSLDIPQITGSQWLELLLKCEKEYSEINSYGYKKKEKK
ncbi:uncharacterized protein CBL_03207 [Carabus blaptoides fortunei]